MRRVDLGVFETIEREAIGLALAQMVGKEAFLEIRLSDRMMLLSIQRRILDWVRTGEEPRKGAELYSDILAVSNLLRRIRLKSDFPALAQSISTLNQLSVSEIQDTSQLANIIVKDHGLTNKIDPGPPTEGNAGQAFDPDIPFRPRRAFERLRNAKVLSDYLGDHYLKVYAACKEAELDRFESVISPAEYDWYLQAE